MQPRTRIWRDGLTVGAIAYAAVALFYLLFDQLAARGSLYTVNLLGQAVFRGLRDPAVLLLPVQLDLTAIALYNALHLALSLAIGVTVLYFVTEAERTPAEAPVMVFTIVTGFLATILGVGTLTGSMRPLLPWWSIVVANTLSVLLAGGYLVRKYPHLVPLMLPVRAAKAVEPAA